MSDSHVRIFRSPTRPSLPLRVCSRSNRAQIICVQIRAYAPGHVDAVESRFCPHRSQPPPCSECPNSTFLHRDAACYAIAHIPCHSHCTLTCAQRRPSIHTCSPLHLCVCNATTLIPSATLPCRLAALARCKQGRARHKVQSRNGAPHVRVAALGHRAKNLAHKYLQAHASISAIATKKISTHLAFYSWFNQRLPLTRCTSASMRAWPPVTASAGGTRPARKGMQTQSRCRCARQPRSCSTRAMREANLLAALRHCQTDHSSRPETHFVH